MRRPSVPFYKGFMRASRPRFTTRARARLNDTPNRAMPGTGFSRSFERTPRTWRRLEASDLCRGLLSVLHRQQCQEANSGARSPDNGFIAPLPRPRPSTLRIRIKIIDHRVYLSPRCGQILICRFIEHDKVCI